jgi:hypothetical protein
MYLEDWSIRKEMPETPLTKIVRRPILTPTVGSAHTHTVWESFTLQGEKDMMGPIAIYLACGNTYQIFSVFHAYTMSMFFCDFILSNTSITLSENTPIWECAKDESKNFINMKSTSQIWTYESYDNRVSSIVTGDSQKLQAYLADLKLLPEYPRTMP